MSGGIVVSDIQIPAKAIDANGADLLEPLQGLLRGINVLPTDADMAKAGTVWATFGGPPQSVALIEAGATAANKWWAAGLGGTVLTVWGSLLKWWGGQEAATQRVALWAVALITAAAVVGIAYLLGSDVRGRAAATVATIEARAKLADAMILSSRKTYSPVAPDAQAQFVALPTAMEVRYIRKGSGDEGGWLAVALMSNGKGINRYLLVKQGLHEWAESADVERV